MFFLTPSDCVFWIWEVELNHADVKMFEELSFLFCAANLFQSDKWHWQKMKKLQALDGFFRLICRWLYSIYNPTFLHGLLVFSLVEQKLSLWQTQLGDKHYVWVFLVNRSTRALASLFNQMLTKYFRKLFVFLVLSCTVHAVLHLHFFAWTLERVPIVFVRTATANKLVMHFSTKVNVTQLSKTQLHS